MGKIIEFKSEHDLDIGTILWVVGKKDIRKYKPCPVCGNDRVITVHDKARNEYDMPCPRCSDKQIKGGSFQGFRHYKAVSYRIYGFEFSVGYSGKAEKKIKLRRSDKDSDHSVYNTDVTDSESLTAKGDWSTDVPTQFYISEDEAKAEAKRLNTEQAVLIKTFLENETV